MTTAQLLGYGIGWAIAAFFTGQDRHGCYLYPRSAAALNAIACAVCAHGAYARGAGTWAGLLFAAMAVGALRWMVMASGDAWAAWRVARDPEGVKRDLKRWDASRKAGGK